MPLVLVATPIGNMGDLAPRAVEALRGADVICCEDTRRTGKLLERAGLIERRKEGREVYISLRGEPLREVAGWVHEYERFWNRRLDEFQQYFSNKKQP